ncbi:ATP-binding cassette domain-containing protein [Lacticaseibacillus parakribbianus]|uniref:ATP-binding cassette domain-containing protein n=1 Tax=Lacticaseibacillus parakribbianus TaxID=2970927 RepID=UPI0021CB4437|nr:ABC transporter ATP-binding protein [Lacticaseibacillus parakribbianus]
MENAVLTIQDVSKRFGHYQALDHVSLTIRRGDVYALVGENGAGKTTLMRMITGLSPISQGAIVLLGENARHYQMALSRIGAVIETPAAFDKLTVAQNLRLTAIQHGVTRDADIEDAIGFVGLTAKRDVKAKNLSLGQRQRLGLATAILAHPDFLILDEPINGLDPTGIVEFRELLHRLNVEKQTTILISSHILSELYQVATRFGFLHHGTIIKEVTRAALDAENSGGLQVTVDDAAKAAQVLDAAGLKGLHVSDDQHLTLAGAAADSAAVNRLLVQAGVAVVGIRVRTTSLEDYYTRLLASKEDAQ